MNTVIIPSHSSVDTDTNQLACTCKNNSVRTTALSSALYNNNSAAAQNLLSVASAAVTRLMNFGLGNSS
jgi:hypothetical protein